MLVQNVADVRPIGFGALAGIDVLPGDDPGGAKFFVALGKKPSREEQENKDRYCILGFNLLAHFS